MPPALSERPGMLPNTPHTQASPPQQTTGPNVNCARTGKSWSSGRERGRERQQLNNHQQTFDCNCNRSHHREGPEAGAGAGPCSGWLGTARSWLRPGGGSTYPNADTPPLKCSLSHRFLPTPLPSPVRALLNPLEGRELASFPTAVCPGPCPGPGPGPGTLWMLSSDGLTGAPHPSAPLCVFEPVTPPVWAHCLVCKLLGQLRSPGCPSSSSQRKSFCYTSVYNFLPPFLLPLSDFICSFLEKGERREKERERTISV